MYTKNQLIEYLVDCNGYSEEYLKQEFKTKEELVELVTDWRQFLQYTKRG